jgi:hypothetical protein
MAHKFRLLAATAVAMGITSVALADVDVPNLTCGSFMAMDSVGKNTAADAVFRWASSTENASQCGSLAAQLGCGTGGELDTSEVRSMIERHCTGVPASANLVEEMRKPDM